MLFYHEIHKITNRKQNGIVFGWYHIKRLRIFPNFAVRHTAATLARISLLLKYFLRENRLRAAFVCKSDIPKMPEKGRYQKISSLFHSRLLGRDFVEP